MDLTQCNIHDQHNYIITAWIFLLMQLWLATGIIAVWNLWHTGQIIYILYSTLMSYYKLKLYPHTPAPSVLSSSSVSSCKLILTLRSLRVSLLQLECIPQTAFLQHLYNINSIIFPWMVLLISECARTWVQFKGGDKNKGGFTDGFTDGFIGGLCTHTLYLYCATNKVKYKLRCVIVTTSCHATKTNLWIVGLSVALCIPLQEMKRTLQ